MKTHRIQWARGASYLQIKAVMGFWNTRVVEVGEALQWPKFKTLLFTPPYLLLNGLEALASPRYAKARYRTGVKMIRIRIGGVS